MINLEVNGMVKTIKEDYDYLKLKSEEVDFEKDNVSEIIQILEDYCVENKVFAMAANQLGYLKRVMYIKHADMERALADDMTYNEKIIMINPRIIKKKGHTTFWEACASCLEYVGLVHRPYKITVEYLDELQIKHKKILEGFEATVFSHEYDHLNGILHIDIAEKLLIMTVEERKELRVREPYNIISKTKE